MTTEDLKNDSGIFGGRLFQEQEILIINSKGEKVGIVTAEKGRNILHWKNANDNSKQMRFDLADNGELQITDGGIADALIKSDELYDGLVPPFIWLDPNIFTDEVKALYVTMPANERPNYLIEILDNFYRNNIEYANFSRVKVYNEPLLLLEFFQSIKKSDFKKCNIELKGRFEELQNRIKEAELSIARTPINTENLLTKWPILRIRELFAESELAALYYLKNPRSENLTTELITDNLTYFLPFGSWLFTTAEAIEHAAAKRNFNYELTGTGKKKNDRSKSVSVKSINDGAGFALTHQKKGAENTIIVLNKDLIQSTSALKLFCFLLAKAAQQNFKPVIKFSLQELVNIGMYSSIISARTGFKNHILSVQSLQIGGEMKKGKRYIKQESGVLFYHNEITQNIVSVWVNEKFDIEFLSSHYAIMPSWAFAVSDNAFVVLLNIFTKSRVERSTKFNISFSLIREKLALPTKEEYIDKGKKFKAGQYVKQPIIDAIDAIQAAITQNKITELKISPHYIVNEKTLEEWLNGYITVELSGSYSTKLSQIREKQNKIIEANTERKEQARAIVEAEKDAEKGNKTEII